jgi:hypothetical protein
MSLTYGLRTAADLFAKLGRDYQLLAERVTSDGLFNFIVTARHLPEWIQKDPASTAEVRQRVDVLVTSPVFKACRDIADASKHFGLTPRRANKTSVSEATSARAFGVGRYGRGPYGVGEELITITMDDGTDLEALAFANELVKGFESLFLAT